MKKIFKIGSLCLIIGLVVFIAVVGCSKKEKITIVGTWNYFINETVVNEIYYEFNKDNTGKYSFYGSEKTFTYEDKGKEIIIKNDDDTNSNKFEYKIVDGTLTLKDNFGDEAKYKKK